MQEHFVIALTCAVLSILVVCTVAQAQNPPTIARLSWTDNSGLNCTVTTCDQEDRFIIEAAAGSGAFIVLGTVAANTTTFDHNLSGIATGTVLTYRVAAENTAGKTYSTGVKFTVPNIPTQAVQPIPPGAVGLVWICANNQPCP